VNTFKLSASLLTTLIVTTVIVAHYLSVASGNSGSAVKPELPAIHQAAVDNNVLILKGLIESGVRMETRTENGSTPLVLAASEGAREAVLHLVKAGANIGSRNHKHRTALHLAAMKGHYQVVSDLLVFGADPMLKDKNGHEAIEHAVAKQTVEHSISFKLIERFAAQPAFDYDNMVIHNQRVRDLKLDTRIKEVLHASYDRINSQK